MKDLGPLSYFLGISVTRNSTGLFLSQEKYAFDILLRAKMADCNPVHTPVDTTGKIGSNVGEPISDPTTYRSLAGALQYLTFTRPDISYAVQQICMHMHDPMTGHFNALKRILRYIKGTIRMGLHMGPTSPSILTSYTDADWAGCPDTRRSTSGYCVYLGDNLISWSSKRQTTISRTSAEAEYRGGGQCGCRDLLHTAIYMAGNPIQHQRTKHIEIDIHFVREQLLLGVPVDDVVVVVVVHRGDSGVDSGSGGAFVSTGSAKSRNDFHQKWCCSSLFFHFSIQSKVMFTKEQINFVM
ncbi:hypothetical protein L1987_06751 [Smallanthus sonchifolius]|uniref:Uncharacterized protein n=1 Tax=Smallanthus sonchifolius TaxID=185202 RepID=A0ACB9JYZ3_9ASTR|nr:hypothetical protein L1987_06751 [Smallanthus sonchifolius]